jgi:hypothetical protein
MSLWAHLTFHAIVKCISTIYSTIATINYTNQWDIMQKSTITSSVRIIISQPYICYIIFLNHWSQNIQDRILIFFWPIHHSIRHHLHHSYFFKFRNRGTPKEMIFLFHENKSSIFNVIIFKFKIHKINLFPKKWSFLPSFSKNKTNQFNFVIFRFNIHRLNFFYLLR